MSDRAEYWKRRYERAEAGRLEALDQLRDTLLQRVNIAADDQQAQIDALERALNKRAHLIGITRNGRKVQFTFVRAGRLTICEFFGTMDNDIESWKHELLEG